MSVSYLTSFTQAVPAHSFCAVCSQPWPKQWRMNTKAVLSLLYSTSCPCSMWRMSTVSQMCLGEAKYWENRKFPGKEKCMWACMGFEWPLMNNDNAKPNQGKCVSYCLISYRSPVSSCFLPPQLLLKVVQAGSGKHVSICKGSQVCDLRNKTATRKIHGTNKSSVSLLYTHCVICIWTSACEF